MICLVVMVFLDVFMMSGFLSPRGDVVAYVDCGSFGDYAKKRDALRKASIL